MHTTEIGGKVDLAMQKLLSRKKRYLQMAAVLAKEEGSHLEKEHIISKACTDHASQTSSILLQRYDVGMM